MNFNDYIKVGNGIASAPLDISMDGSNGHSFFKITNTNFGVDILNINQSGTTFYGNNHNFYSSDGTSNVNIIIHSGSGGNPSISFYNELFSSYGLIIDGSNIPSLSAPNTNRIQFASNVGINAIPTTDTSLYVIGSTADVSAYVIKLDDINSGNLFSVRNDGFVGINTATKVADEHLNVNGSIFTAADEGVYYGNTNTYIEGASNWTLGGASGQALVHYNGVGNIINYVNGAAQYFQSIKFGQGTVKTDAIFNNDGSFILGYNVSPSDANALLTIHNNQASSTVVSIVSSSASNLLTILDNYNVGIGIGAPSAALEVVGSLKFGSAGTPAVGKILTSDAVGNATWGAGPAISLLGKITMDLNALTPLTNPILDYDTLVGTFQVGEAITGGVSLATAIIVTDDGSSEMTLSNIVGTFQVGEAITGGTSLATANIDDVILDTPSIQPISLTGGNTFVVTDVVLTNASTSINTASGFTIRNSNQDLICFEGTSALVKLVSPTNMVNGNIRINNNFNNYLNMNSGFSTCGNTINASLNINQGATASMDVYVYGYTLN